MINGAKPLLVAVYAKYSIHLTFNAMMAWLLQKADCTMASFVNFSKTFHEPPTNILGQLSPS